ncbi:NUDIX domain-containing protein [Tenacibaculum sp. HL-MS23]|uniref:NUDIX hydrolase n=1 Tax=Tenacibaculum TaxID=104267 RepID=UPI001C4F35CC|nr:MULTISPECIES: NUDIX domain-containing protein [Tenacibaculum]QXP74247.1 NUDIX domain-containing protein [Tenacibaculum sp. AHE14PA]QXP75383.1 NUDIX domain-containing protein [Tenacibaculum sp. AHE15PA]WNW01937.1 NUDIX domain-containing protein [Tenacibaculum sp. HL-MS23]
MYKVFVNDKPIIFTTSVKNEEDYVVYIYKNTIIEELIYKLKLGKLKGVYLCTSNLEEDWEIFKMKFKVLVAAGGLVLNDKKEILFIYRGSKWDLPKGRQEKGENIKETAIREVEEECGITNLKIDKKLIKTYHFFIQKGKHRLKETHWYLMSSSYKGILTPQLEEGITKVMFKDAEATNKALKSTFSNIVMVYKFYVKSLKK